MKIQEQYLEMLEQGVEHWNEMRQLFTALPELSGADLSEMNLSGANLCEADLTFTNLWKADLSEADLYRAYLWRADLGKANLSNANLYRADLREANLSEAIFKDAILSADLSRSVLIEANLAGADLSRASLTEAVFNRADLSNANLSNADLTGANLSYANLNNAILRNAHLFKVNLTGAKLTGADFSEVALGEAIFADNDLRTVKGLLEVHHYAPSSVMLYTVKLPQDGSELHFLRGTGVSDEQIYMYPSAVTSRILYHSCFISYAHQDEMLAYRLHADLQAHGVRCWFAAHDMRIGDKIRPRIGEAIYLHDKLLLLLSEHALASDWVEDEVETAYEKEARQKREVLFPVRLDESIMQAPQAWAAKLRRTRHIGDFTHWKNHDDYQKGFYRLLRDLKAGA